MNANIIIWALLTGLISGGVWIGIVVLKHQRELDRYDYDDMLAMEQRLAELEHVATRVSELEERIEFTERMLTAARDPARSRGEPPNQPT